MKTAAASDAATPAGAGIAPPRAAPVEPAVALTAPAVQKSGSPLFDPENEYTVVVATYARSAEELAWATHDHLRDARLPVFPLIEVSGKIVILVGAAPTYAGLSGVEEQVRGLSRDGVARIYEDAYRQRIDDLIER